MSKLEQLKRRTEAAAAAATPSTSAAPRSRVAAGAVIGILTTIGLVLLKGKGLVVLLLTKLKVLVQFATTAWTMLLAAWVYAMFYGWRFAAILVGLILIHEIGHGIAARAVGMRVGAPVFIPFFGAYIQLKDQPRTQVENFVIAAGGPVVGGVASLVLFALSFAVGEPTSGLLRAVGYYGLWLNLFNLTPVWQLDGARMLGIVRPVAGLIGAGLAGAVLVACAVVTDRVEPIPALVLIVA
ncbi:MAG: site-2 protease family protein, partial [Myxococcota bacterium]|nr:site-2 protease family protein [Myxococcota bacterium]